MRSIPPVAALLLLSACDGAAPATKASDPGWPSAEEPHTTARNANAGPPPGQQDREVEIRRILVASDDLIDHGHTLSTQFRRMTGRSYPVQVGTSTRSGDLYLTQDTRDDAPDYTIEPITQYVVMQFRPGFATRATWHLLRHLGYRQFMPGAAWEHVPQRDRIAFSGAIERRESFVDFGNLGTGGIPYLGVQPLIADWQERNGLDTVVRVATGHAWQALIRDHPELQDSRYQVHNKLNVLEPLVQERALQWTMDLADADPETRVWSMTPSDGSLGWDLSTTGEHLLYNPSDRALLLANHVQRGLLERPGYDHLRVGLYAYAETSRTPTVDIDPHLIIGITDGFYRDGQSWDKVLADYRSRGATDFFGYFYWEVYPWSWDEPGKTLMSDRSRWARMTERALGLPPMEPRILSGEAGASWGSTAQGKYALARALDQGEPIEDAEAFFDESLEEMVATLFPNVTAEMTAYFDLVTARGTTPLLFSHFVHQCYKALITAMEAPGATAIERERIAELIKYVHYLDLRVVLNAQEAYSEAELDAFEDMVRWAWTIRMTGLVNWRAITRQQPLRWAHLWEALEARLGIPLNTLSIDRLRPWGPEQTLDPDGLLTLAHARLEVHPTYPFEPRAWSDDPLDLVPVTQEDPRIRGTIGYFRPDHAPGTEWYFATAPGHDTLTWELRSGLVFGRPMTLEFIRMSGGIDEVVGSWTFPGESDGEVWHTLSATVEPGEVYRVRMYGPDGHDGMALRWWTVDGTGATRFTAKPEVGGMASPFIPSSSWYFYVPAGTEVIGGYWSGAQPRLLDPDNQTVLTKTEPGTQVFQYELPEPAPTGQIWRLQAFQGPTALLTVPPHLAQHPSELLVPREALGE